MSSGRRAWRPSRSVVWLGFAVTLVLHLLLLVSLRAHWTLSAPTVALPQETLVNLAPLQMPPLPRVAAPVPVRPASTPDAPEPPEPPVALPAVPPADTRVAAAPPAEAGASAAPVLVPDDEHQGADPAAALAQAEAERSAAVRLPVGSAPAQANGGASAPALPEALGAALARLPQEGEVDYQVSLGSGDWQVARGTLRWRITGLRYRIDLSAQAVGIARLLKSNVVSQVSEGRITPDGLAPDHFRVLGRTSDTADESARFDWTAGQLTFQPSGLSQALPEGTQDLLSFFLQFALLPPHTDSVLKPVTNGRKLDRYAFELTDRGILQLPIGALETVHISKLHGTNEDDFDVWLAQDRHYLPVQMRFRARGRLLTLSAVAIRVAGLHSAL